MGYLEAADHKGDNDDDTERDPTVYQTNGCVYGARLGFTPPLLRLQRTAGSRVTAVGSRYTFVSPGRAPPRPRRTVLTPWLQGPDGRLPTSARSPRSARTGRTAAPGHGSEPAEEDRYGEDHDTIHCSVGPSSWNMTLGRYVESRCPRAGLVVVSVGVAASQPPPEVAADLVWRSGPAGGGDHRDLSGGR